MIEAIIENSWAVWLLTTPFGGLILSFIVAKHFAAKQAEKEHKQCPRCAESIKRMAMVCRYCGYEYKATDDLRIA